MAGKLKFVDDSEPGISRRRKGVHWQYFAPDGKRIAERAEIDRLNAIGLPPAYRDAWFCTDPDGHLQSVGKDARGRKQYRYHAEYRAGQDSAKYERLAEFGHHLPRLRKRIEEDIGGKATNCDTVVAAVVRLIDRTHIRVGNEQYAKSNKSFGATTLRGRHAKISNRGLTLRYRGKSGIVRETTVTDRALARVAKRAQDLPGQHLFECADAEGTCRPVRSNDVNDYIREATGEEFTAKDFRTWGASVIAFAEAVERTRRHGSVHLKSMIEPVAEALGNTMAVSRKSYVHPALIEAAQEADAFAGVDLPRKAKWLSGAERGFIDFLDALRKKRPKRSEVRKGS